MLVLEIIIATVICIVVPPLIGDLLLPSEVAAKRYIMGIFGTLALAQLLFLPFIIHQHHFTPYFLVFISLIAGLCIYAVIKNNKRYGSEWTAFFSFKWLKDHISIWMIVALVVIGTQVVRVTFGHFFVYADNSTYIPIINDLIETDKDAYLFIKTGEPGFVETDRKYLFTTYFPYLASICKLSGVHPAVLVQTILPPILTIVSYMLVWQYGYFLFKDKKAAWIFTLFFSILIETIGGYDYTYANHVLTGIYFGKKIVFTILLPSILLFLGEKTSILEDNVSLLSRTDVFRLAVMMLGTSAPSLMGTGLAPIVLFCMGIVLVIRKKSIKPMFQMMVGMVPAIVMLFMVIYYLYFKG